ncbi:MAG: hypothetical protein R3C68_07095 [Myxococcota bacterium]
MAAPPPAVAAPPPAAAAPPPAAVAPPPAAGRQAQSRGARQEERFDVDLSQEQAVQQSATQSPVLVGRGKAQNLRQVEDILGSCSAAPGDIYDCGTGEASQFVLT